MPTTISSQKLINMNIFHKNKRSLSFPRKYFPIKRGEESLIPPLDNLNYPIPTKFVRLIHQFSILKHTYLFGNLNPRSSVKIISRLYRKVICIVTKYKKDYYRRMVVNKQNFCRRTVVKTNQEEQVVLTVDSSTK